MIKQQVPFSGKSFFTANYFNAINKNILLTLISEEEAIKAYNQVLFFAQNAEVLYFPSVDTIPYDRISPNQYILSERANVLSDLATSKAKKIVITNAANLLIKLPPPSIFAETILKLHRNMKFTSEQLASFLVKNGFNRSASAVDISEFAIRGEIVDIVLSSDSAYRVNFSWDHIESIKKYDIDSQISHSPQEELIINSVNEIILNTETINSFKSNYLQNFGVNHTNTPLYTAIIEGRKFPGYEHLLPLFYNKLNMLIDYLADPIILYEALSLQSILEYENSYKDFYQSRIQSNKINPGAFYPALAPEQICFHSSKIKEVLNHEPNIFIEPNSNVIPRLEDITKLLELISNNSKKIIIIFCHSKSGLERLKNIVQHYKYKYIEIEKLEAARGDGIINFAQVPLTNGFYTNEYLFISEKDIFGEKFSNSSTQTSKRRLKNILTELDNLSEGDLVVHKDHGIGKFITAEIIEVSGKPHDCLKILYADNDKLYIPVENIESIKKYGTHEAELDKLGGISWQKRKARVKNRITEIAAKLLQITARRKIAEIELVEFDLTAYDQFCARFNYTETEDQIKAIDEIRSDFASGMLMDRLICGDVGFGKTEVAMRATYIIAKSNQMLPPQVAIISPTTILCKQHYSRFLERFNNLGLNIVQLSRLIKSSDAKKIKDQIKNGTANIIIGTHALLAKNIEFSNLKLLIIDEEQHFGVSQKERLKELKSDIHVLSLSATPIPRTLQMSLVGLKDLSLIATPPVDRLAVHTTVMPFDSLIIRDALLKEHFRGGRSFYVAPRIKDIAEIESTLKTIVPELKFKVAHGQMLPALVDEIMTEFYDGKFDILLSTTIIESGIDIPAANTMIIHKANKLGLSQLYQLKGRIGRSKIRGYAYLTLATNKPISKHSIKRLEIVQTASSLGSGFTIASHDMDLRGFGNLVGEEQSGQIKEVGVELYQDMLDEQVAILKNEPSRSTQGFVPTINLGLPILISDSYIPDSSLRLGIYRRIGDLLTNQEVESFKDEMIDRFGPIPQEFDNLLNIVKIKQVCNKLNVENLDSGERGFVLKFHHNNTNVDLIIKFVNKYPSQAKIKPDNKLIFIKNLKQVNIIHVANELLHKLESLSKD